MTDQEKLRQIASICAHPGVFHWSGSDVARAVRRVIDESPIPFVLSEIDEPVHYEMVHDAVYEEL